MACIAVIISYVMNIDAQQAFVYPNTFLYLISYPSAVSSVTSNKNTSHRRSSHLFVYPSFDFLISLLFGLFDFNSIHKPRSLVTTFNYPTVADLIDTPHIIPVETEKYSSHSIRENTAPRHKPDFGDAPTWLSCHTGFRSNCLSALLSSKRAAST